MKLGICTGPENMQLAAELGYDYIEWALNAIAAMPQERFEALREQAPNFPVPLAKCNCFLPGDLHPTGPDVSESSLRAYLEKAFSRAHALGVKLVVFGSGGARQVPQGFSHGEAWRQIADFLRLAGEYAQKYDIDIAIEPLRRKECNILNFVSEGTMMAALVNHPRVGVLGDSFHMLCGHEPWEALRFAGKNLMHVHISHALPDLSSRDYPAPGDGTDYGEILGLLKDMGYAGGVSIEAGTKDLAKDAAKAMACLKPLL